MTAMVSAMETEKLNLMQMLDVMKQKNFMLERSNEDLSSATLSTMSPLKDRQAGKDILPKLWKEIRGF